MKYIEIENLDGRNTISRQNDDGTVTSIPMDEANSDYQRYLRWLENPEAEAESVLP